MILFRILLLPLCLVGLAFGAEPTDATKRLMTDIAVNARDLATLTYPRPTGFDPQGQAVATATRFFQRDLPKLIAIDPELVNSDLSIHGTAFRTTVANARAIIDSNAKAAAEARPAPGSKKASNGQPAASSLAFAITVGKAGVRLLASQDPDRMSKASAQAKLFKQLRDEALAVDPTAATQATDDLAMIERELLVPVAAFDLEQAQAALAKDDAEKAAKKAAAERSAAAIEAGIKSRDAEARRRGFEASAADLVSIVSEIRDQELTVEKAKTVLVFASDADLFKVSSVVDGYAIFTAVQRRGEPVQIAVVKRPGDFYGEGAALALPLLRLLEVKTFTKALGGQVDLLVFAAVE